ncbi:hypothetical protein [Kangiella sp. M94]
MNKSLIVQVLISLLVGAGVFYISAPHSWGVGIVFQEIIYGIISLGISLAILFPTVILLFKGRKKYPFSILIFSIIGCLLLVYFYPANYRYSTPSEAISNEVEALLIDKGMPSTVDFQVIRRKKVPFDIFAEHNWEVEVSGNKAGEYLYFYYIERFGEGELVTYGESNWSKLN